MKINNNIKKFFNDLDIDIEEILEEEVLDEASFEPDLKAILSKLGNIQGANNSHKLLFAAGLLELRSQVKKNQEQISETRRQIEKGFKDLEGLVIDLTRKQESLSKNVNFLKDSLSNISRAVSSKTTISPYK